MKCETKIHHGQAHVSKIIYVMLLFSTVNTLIICAKYYLTVFFNASFNLTLLCLYTNKPRHCSSTIDEHCSSICLFFFLSSFVLFFAKGGVLLRNACFSSNPRDEMQHHRIISGQEGELSRT